MATFFDLPIEQLQNLKIKSPAVPNQYITLKFLEDQNTPIPYECPQPFADSSLVRASIDSAKVLAKADDVRSVYEIVLNTKSDSFDDSPMKFLPGDTIGILPQNSEQDVEYIIERLGLKEKSDMKFELECDCSKKGAKLPIFVPKRYTIRKTIKECLDLYCVPKKLFLRHLASFTSDSEESNCLNYLSSPQGKADYQKLFLESSKNLLNLLKTFKTCQPPFSILLEHLTRLMPRPYSIASSPLIDPHQLRIIFSVTGGVTSKYLELLCSEPTNSDQTVGIYFRPRNSFRYSTIAVAETIIMIAAGSAISPFIGMIEHAAALKSPVRIWLITGCRYRDRNNLYHDLLQSWVESGVIWKLSQAFSRGNAGDEIHKYARDHIRTKCDEFAELFIEQNATVMVCGNSETMVPDTLETIAWSLVNKKMTKEDAFAFIEKAKTENRYLEDKWI